MQWFLILSAAVASVTVALCYSSLFDFLRKGWLAPLFKCAFCMAHWLSFGIAFRFNLHVGVGSFFGFCLAVLAMGCFAALMAGIINLTIYRPERQIAHLKKLLRDAREALNDRHPKN